MRASWVRLGLECIALIFNFNSHNKQLGLLRLIQNCPNKQFPREIITQTIIALLTRKKISCAWFTTEYRSGDSDRGGPTHMYASEWLLCTVLMRTVAGEYLPS